jgi:choline dehydrogenase-like flavoprotein
MSDMATGELRDLPGKPSLNGPNRPDGIYVIRFANPHAGPRSKKFLRGYGYQGYGGISFNWGAAGFGNAYKKSLLDPVTTVGVGGYGECLPRWENYVELDRNVVDTFGIPVLRIHMSYGENELALVKAMAESAGEMLEAVGARNIHVPTNVSGGPGWAIHEVGVARMGNDPRKSVLNQFQQTHDIKNLFVMDGAGFTSTACQNPTLTIMALCIRSCDYLMDEMKRGNI